MSILKVKGLCKRYEKFYLDNVSFDLDEGYIMGFIGSNGAGKTTTLKGIMNLIHTESGEVEVFGKPFKGNEIELKQDIAFMLGGGSYYQKRKLKAVTNTVRRFYKNWNEEAYQGYLLRFDLDPEKTLEKLSQGMQVKYSLALALSHNARLLLLDEPTSGLDPVARDDLLELFQELVEDGTRSILFSTHITSDLEKCADFITFIQNGKILEAATKDDLIDSYRLVSGSAENLGEVEDSLISHKKGDFGFTGLIRTEKSEAFDGLTLTKPALDDIMIYHARKEKKDAQYAL